MSVSARIFFVGGAISYRALFNWIQPGMYAATMLGSPLFQILFFTYLAATPARRTTRSSSSGTRSRWRRWQASTG